MPDSPLPRTGMFWLPTEQINPETTNIDLLSTTEILVQLNRQDQQVPLAVEKALPDIAHVVAKTVEALSRDGRLFYFGAGTSGRLGVLDAAECPPTFGTDPAQVQAFIAGGETALRQAVEGAEDRPELGRQDLERSGAGAGDVVVGLSASGGAPYVVAALETARAKGCFTAAITCCRESRLARAVDQAIGIDVGPEAIAGSTRLKAGTAQKLVLNLISTATMVQLGKTYENLMVDVRPTNQKLLARARRIVAILAEVPEEQAEKALEQSGFLVKPAVLMLQQNVPLGEAERRLAAVSGKLRAALLQSYPS